MQKRLLSQGWHVLFSFQRTPHGKQATTSRNLPCRSSSERRCDSLIESVQTDLIIATFRPGARPRSHFLTRMPRPGKRAPAMTWCRRSLDYQDTEFIITKLRSISAFADPNRSSNPPRRMAVSVNRWRPSVPLRAGWLPNRCSSASLPYSRVLGWHGRASTPTRSTS
jgi:hypothetical protein